VSGRQYNLGADAKSSRERKRFSAWMETRGQDIRADLYGAGGSDTLNDAPVNGQ
jgi:hypothetical protein